MDINTMCVQYFRRYRMPTTAGGWFFFLLSIVCLAVGRYRGVSEKITTNEATQKVIRVVAYIAFVICMILAIMADVNE